MGFLREFKDIVTEATEANAKAMLRLMRRVRELEADVRELKTFRRK
jgi:hypothetical protein